MSSLQKIYRVCCYDPAHNLLSAELIEAASDEEAIALVESGEFGTQCEIWEGHRLVAQLECERRQA